MASAVVMSRPKLCQIDTVTIDACREEQHAYTNTTTDNPVEQGFDITDHVRPNPDRVTLECFISNTPLSVEQVQRAVREGTVKLQTTASGAVKITETNTRAQAAYDKLKKLRDDGTMIKVVTTLRTYGVSSTEGMVIDSLTIPRNTSNYDGLEFSMALKQIRVVKNKQARVVRSKDPRAGKKVATGTKVPEQQQDFDSAAFKATNSETVDNMSKSDGVVGKFGGLLKQIGAGPQ